MYNTYKFVAATELSWEWLPASRREVEFTDAALGICDGWETAHNITPANSPSPPT